MTRRFGLLAACSALFITTMPISAVAAPCPGGATTYGPGDESTLETDIEAAVGDLTVCISGVLDLSGLTSSGGVLIEYGGAGTLEVIGTTDAAGSVLDANSAGVPFGATGNLAFTDVTIREGLGIVSTQASGAFAFGSVTVTDSVFDSNVDGIGGGVFGFGGGAIVDSVFLNNRGTAVGAAIFVGNSPVTVSGSTFSDNSGPATGLSSGAIGLDITDSITVTNSVFSNNSAGGGGALVLAPGAGTPTVSVSDSSFTGNSALDFGGGAISIFDGGAVDISNSTFTSNSSGSDGGAAHVLDSGNLTISGATFVGNAAPTGSGGGVFVDGAGISATLQNSTFSGNSAGTGGAMFGADGSGSVIALDHVTAGPGQDLLSVDAEVQLLSSVVDGCSTSGAATITSLGSNFDTGGSCGLAGIGDLTGADPLLVALADNGGPTQTMLPGPGSPLIDASAVGLTVDQRGVSRPLGSSSDIGAVELDLGAITAADLTVVDEPEMTTTVDLAPLVTTSNTTVASFELVSALGGSGSVTGTELSFDRTLGFTSDATAVYRVTDNYGQTAEGTVTFDLNLEPLVAESFNLIEDTGAPLDIDLSSRVSGNTTPTSTQLLSVNHGTVAVSGLTLTYLAPTGFVGLATVEYTVSDGWGQTSNPAMITIDVLETLPATGLDADVLALLAFASTLVGLAFVRFSIRR